MQIFKDGFFPDPIERDLFFMFCGERIGSGMSREVWTHAFDDRWVIKFEQAGFFQNAKEWDTWNDAKLMGNCSDQWLAPCDRISSNGRILIQRRTKTAKSFPDKMPVFLNDFKKTNYGMIGGKLVCHDYGTNLMCNSGLSQRLRKVKWYDE